MITKSVSGSTLIVALGAVLRQLLILPLLVVISSWPVWGWVGEAKDPMKACLGNACVAGMSRDTMDKLACFQRMREAMKVANGYLVPPIDTGARLAIPGYCFELCQAERRVEVLKKKDAVLTQWNQVMTDCVEGGQ